jgi:hypothetical protein
VAEDVEIRIVAACDRLLSDLNENASASQVLDSAACVVLRNPPPFGNESPRKRERQLRPLRGQGP